MAKPRPAKTKTPIKATFNKEMQRPKPFIGLILLAFSMLLFLALGDYDHTQISFFSTKAPEQNLVGNVGAEAARICFSYFGFASWIFPSFILWLSVMLFSGQSKKVKFSTYLCALGALMLATIILSMASYHWYDQFENNTYPYGIGGWIGQNSYEDFLLNSFGLGGTAVVSCSFFLFCIGWIIHNNLGLIFVKLAHRMIAKRVNKNNPNVEKELKKKTAELEKEKRLAEKQKEREIAAEKKKHSAECKNLEKEKRELEKVASKAQKEKQIAEKHKQDAEIAKAELKATKATVSLFSKAKQTNAKNTEKPSKETKEVKELSEKPIIVKKPKIKEVEEDKDKVISFEQTPDENTLKVFQAETTAKASAPIPKDKEDYKFPNIELLHEAAGNEGSMTVEEHQLVMDDLVRTLSEFGVKVSAGEVHAGPVITRYDVYPAPGVRVEKISSLDKNIALGLKALSVRILAPVPGKGCVGVEVPNAHAQAVYIRDIIDSAAWSDSKAHIPIALGKEVSGKPLVTDLTKMPHLLIAGATGAGKTVCINSIITSLVYKLTPKEVRFVMVDPKVVEMQVYNSLPHMMIPVVTDPKKVPGALKYLINEMERRYHLFAKYDVRNIGGYNAKMAKDKKEAKEAEELSKELDASLSPEERAASNNIEVPRQPDLFEDKPEKLPYIVCIVDELADLMMVAPADIETGIARLAQLARAAGIHLILATQRPSTNVITGVIKANLPCRIAFKSSSQIDSRTILDSKGAEQLIGRGDMLFLPPGSADLLRSQGAFVDDDEINGIVDWIKENNDEPNFDEQFQRSVDEGGDDLDGSGGGDGEWDDDMAPKAIEVLKSTQRASTSMLQRRLKIGYNRAARIMEEFEDKGIVGPENGSSPREILMDLENY